MTYNPRRHILGAMPLKGKISYHLFTVDTYTSKTEAMVKLSRKSKWHSQHRTSDTCNSAVTIILNMLMYIIHIDNIVTSFDFDPNGEKAATIDRNGMCVISHIDTNGCDFHLALDGRGGIQSFFFNLLYLKLYEYFSI